MLTPVLSPNNRNRQDFVDRLYYLCKTNQIDEIRAILPFIDKGKIINEFETSTGSTCLHVACYYGHKDVVQLLLECGASRSIRNRRHNLTPFEESHVEAIKQIFVEYKKFLPNGGYDHIEWSMTGDDLLEKRREFREKIDLYKTYGSRHLTSKLLAEVIHYYLKEYLVNEKCKGEQSESQANCKELETIQACFEEAIKQDDFLTYFIKAYTLSTRFHRDFNRHLALFILDFFDETKYFSGNYRLINCLVHLVTLLIYDPKLSKYQYQGLCYRGMRITPNDLDQYQLNQHILNRSLLSASTDREVAEMFAGEGQQSNMRHTPDPQNRRALQYSCVCVYLIKHHKTAVNVEKLSMRPDEKEVLILPFSVFKVTKIQRNDFDSTVESAKIKVEIKLEECEDSNSNEGDRKYSELEKRISLSSYDSDGKDLDELKMSKRRKYLLFAISGSLILTVLLTLGLTSIFVLTGKRDINSNITNTTKPRISDDIDTDFSLASGCPEILNRSSWNARPYASRDNLTVFPVTHIVVRSIEDSITIMDHQDCIQNMKQTQAYHMAVLGWFDIGYNFVICNTQDDEQEIYKGRGWRYIGAHCKGYNARSLGIGILGNYNNTNMLKAFKSLIQCGIQSNSIMPNFTLMGNLNSPGAYDFYLKQLVNDTDLHFSNRISGKRDYC